MTSREVKPRQLLKALLKAGFEIKRQRGSHVFIDRVRSGEIRMTSISLHTRPMPLGTLRAVLKQTGLSEEELRKLL